MFLKSEKTIMTTRKPNQQGSPLTQALLHVLPLLMIVSPTATHANGFETCDYNGRAMRCKRSFNNGVVTVTWQDGITDHYQRINRTTTTTLKWRDSRGGQWNSLAYSGSLILVNPNNNNTIIIGGTRKQCRHQWKLGNVCGGH